MHILPNDTPVYEFVVRNFIPVIPFSVFTKHKNLEILKKDIESQCVRKTETLPNPFPYSRATFSCALTKDNSLAVGFMVHSGYTIENGVLRRTPYNKKIGRAGARARLQNLLETGVTTNHSFILSNYEMTESVLNYELITDRYGITKTRDFSENELKPFIFDHYLFEETLSNANNLFFGSSYEIPEPFFEAIKNSAVILKNQLVLASTNLEAMKDSPKLERIAL